MRGVDNWGPPRPSPVRSTPSSTPNDSLRKQIDALQKKLGKAREQVSKLRGNIAAMRAKSNNGGGGGGAGSDEQIKLIQDELRHESARAEELGDRLLVSEMELLKTRDELSALGRKLDEEEERAREAEDLANVTEQTLLRAQDELAALEGVGNENDSLRTELQTLQQGLETSRENAQILRVRAEQVRDLLFTTEKELTREKTDHEGTERQLTVLIEENKKLQQRVDSLTSES